MHEIAQLIESGLTGIYAAGASKHSRTAEGLRTELPFLYNHEAQLDKSSRKVLRDCEIHDITKVSNVSIMFEGRADLVMAYSGPDGEGYLQIVDMKTTGCLFGFNYENGGSGPSFFQNVLRVMGTADFTSGDSSPEKIAKLKPGIDFFNNGFKLRKSGTGSNYNDKAYNYIPGFCNLMISQNMEM